MCTIKFGIFGIFMKFYGILILPFKTPSVDIFFGVIIIASFIFTLISLREFTIKKILAFTSVNQTGYILMGLLVSNPDSITSVF